MVTSKISDRRKKKGGGGERFVRSNIGVDAQTLQDRDQKK